MNQTPLAEPEANAQLTKFEQFLIANKRRLMLASFLGAFVITVSLMPRSGPMHASLRSRNMQTARTIELALFQYANDHDGKYPTGKSSTEIFQQLIDQQYIYDSTIFYFPMPGKIKPEGTKLKPENVSWDVTNGVLPDDPDELPVVFATGYKIDYIPNGKAHPLASKQDGLPLAYKSNSTRFLPAVQSDGVVTNIVETTFDPKGRTYQQLTPNGPLP